MITFLEPEDVVLRLWSSKQFWPHGPPKVRVIGEEGGFGTLRFEFADETVDYAVYLPRNQSTRIELRAAHAVADFENIALTNLYPILFVED